MVHGRRFIECLENVDVLDGEVRNSLELKKSFKIEMIQKAMWNRSILVFITTDDYLILLVILSCVSGW